ncbi:MAG: protein-L-isoaspartate(D-aspartate) O-methyltransferase [Elusimicrobiales bacterium]|nr:protein-L-isoaspartate(D-aspartate) O-methyltransferase [Elusimicrobiales bacterium]
MFKELLGKRYDAYLDFIRQQMIKDQIEARGVKDPRVLAAMRKVCRHCFVTEDMVSRAYEDYPLPLARGQTISQPYIVALMSELARLSGTERVLEIGTGSGYQTAVLAELAAEVDTIEIFPDLAQAAAARLAGLGCSNVTYRTGDGAGGWPERAPYDAILVTCAAPEVPAALAAQLKPGGRLVVPVGSAQQELRLLTLTSSGLLQRSVCAVNFVPLLTEAR